MHSPVSAASSTSSSTPGSSSSTLISTIPVPTSSVAAQRHLKAMKLRLGVGLELGLPFLIILIGIFGLLLMQRNGEKQSSGSFTTHSGDITFRKRDA